MLSPSPLSPPPLLNPARTTPVEGWRGSVGAKDSTPLLDRAGESRLYAGGQLARASVRVRERADVVRTVGIATVPPSWASQHQSPVAAVGHETRTAAMP